MKFKSLFTAGLMLAAVGIASAALPTFKTLSATGNATTPSAVYFPTDPNSQIRVVYVNYSNDTAAAAIQFLTGNGNVTLLATNPATTTVTNFINSTNGLPASGILLLEHGGTPYTNSLVTYGVYTTGTNTFGAVTNQYFLKTGSGGFGVLPSIGDNIYVMTQGAAIPVPVGSGGIGSDGLYVGNYGRPVQVILGAATATNDLYSVTAHYDSASQYGN